MTLIHYHHHNSENSISYGIIGISDVYSLNFACIQQNINLVYIRNYTNETEDLITCRSLAVVAVFSSLAVASAEDS